LELEHGGGGSVAENPLFKRLIEHCQKTEFDGESLLEDQDVRDLIADMLNDLDVQRLMGLRNFWHRYVRDPHPYGGPQFLYFQRMVRLRNSERVQKMLGFDALAPDASVHEQADFEYTVRSGPGWLHGGGTLDTDRLIIARRLGLGRPQQETAPTTV
jgi:hypothetical protein